VDKAGMMIAINIYVDSKGKGFRTIALGSMPRFLCYPED
jgi:hypothetical protein